MAKKIYSNKSKKSVFNNESKYYLVRCIGSQLPCGEVLFTLIDKHTFRFSENFFSRKKMPQMLMITVKYNLIIESLWNWWNLSISRYIAILLV